MAGRSIFVINAFNLLLNEVEMAAAGVASNMVRLGVGRHDNVPDVIANHPQTRLNSGDDAQLAAVMAAPTAPAADMVPLADLVAARGEAESLRQQVADLENRAGVQASMVSALQDQARTAGEARAASESALVEAAERIRSLASRLNIPPESVMPPALAGRATETAAAPDASQDAPQAPAPASEAATPPAEPVAAVPAPAAAAEPASPTPEIQTAGTPDVQTPAEPVAAVTVQHKGAGRYAVFRGDEQVTEPTTRDEAEAQAAAMAAPAPAATA